jgi:mycofactocin precursor
MNREPGTDNETENPSVEQDVVTAESLIEEVSIDGMCGVY